MWVTIVLCCVGGIVFLGLFIGLLVYGALLLEAQNEKLAKEQNDVKTKED